MNIKHYAQCPVHVSVQHARALVCTFPHPGSYSDSSLSVFRRLSVGVAQETTDCRLQDSFTRFPSS